MSRKPKNGFERDQRAIVYLTKTESAGIHRVAEANDRPVSREIARAVRGHIAAQDQTQRAGSPTSSPK